VAVKIKGVTVIGAEQVLKDFKDFEFAGHRVIPKYLDLIAESALELLKQNTPVDTGALRDSWRILERGSNYVELGVTPDQEEKLTHVVNGTRFTPKNDFINDVDSFINQLMQDTISDLLARQHRFWGITKGKSNLSKIVGLTKTSLNKRRLFGRVTLPRPRTGRLKTTVRIGRIRPRGKVMKRVKLG
jgi:hypothetical protein